MDINEVSRETQAKSYRELEEEISLYLRPKARDPNTYYYEWLKIAPLDTGSHAIYPLKDASFDGYVKIAETELPKAMK